MSTVTIVFPDVGPLITLAKADALEFLLAFSDEIRLVLTDVVEFEATRFRSDHQDAQKICDFISANSGRLTIEGTTYGKQAISAAKARQRYDESPEVQAFFAANQMPPPGKMAADCGELSIVSFIADMIGAPPGPACLVIAEDDFFLRANSGALPGNAHIISTAAFLKALEVLNPNCNAKSVFDAAASAGRRANNAEVDKTAGKIKGGTTWREAIDPQKLKESIAARRKRLEIARKNKP